MQFMSMPPDDFESLFQLSKDGLKPYVDRVFGWDDDDQRQRIRNEYDWSWMHWIVESSHTLGSVCFKRIDQALHLHLILIDDRFQGQGVGRRVMNQLHALAKQENRDVTLSCFKINERAVNLYRSLGYETVTEEEHFYIFRLTKDKL